MDTVSKKKFHVLLAALFLVACGTAFCLGTLAYILAENKLPFGIEQAKPLIKHLYVPEEDPKKSKEETNAEENPTALEHREIDELYLIALNQDLRQQEKDLQVEQQKIKDLETSLKSREDLLQELHKALLTEKGALESLYKDKEEKLKSEAVKISQEQSSLLSFVSVESESRLKELSDTLASMRPEAQVNFIYYLDRKTAAQVLYLLSTAKRAKILEMLYDGKVGENVLPAANRQILRTAAQEIVLEIQKIKTKKEVVK